VIYQPTVLKLSFAPLSAPIVKAAPAAGLLVCAQLAKEIWFKGQSGPLPLSPVSRAKRNAHRSKLPANQNRFEPLALPHFPSHTRPNN
jgi:hypothetical protein